MNDWDGEFYRSQCSSQRRIGIAVDQEPVGPLSQKEALDTFDHRGGLLSVSSGPNLEVNVRCGKIQSVEEDSRHLVVVVLTCMNEDLGVTLSQHAAYRSGFYELRSCTYDRYDFHLEFSLHR